MMSLRTTAGALLLLGGLCSAAIAQPVNPNTQLPFTEVGSGSLAPGPAQRHRLYVVGVRGTALVDSDLTRWGNVVNAVRASEPVLVVRLSRSGNFVRVQPASGSSGYMRVDQVELGVSPLPSLPSPSPLSTPSTGAAGALGSATSGN